MDGIKLFGDFEEKITSYRHLLQKIIAEEYQSGKYSDLSSREVQEIIFGRFHDDIKESLGSFKESFNKEVLHRSDVLERYVSQSVDEILGWDGNKDLLKANFVNAVVRYKNKDKIVSKATQVDKYYGEQDLHNSIKKDPNEFLPSINGNGQASKISIDELINNIEIISVSNITGLYNKNVFLNNLFDSLKYKLYSRVKSSEREMIKLVDYFFDLRAENDYPFDSTGLMFVSPDHLGRKIYKFKDFIENYVKNNYKNDPKFFAQVIKLSNVKTTQENESTIAKKLTPDYNYKNYRDIVSQCNYILKALDKIPFSEGNINGNTKIEGVKVKDWLMQGLQIKHIYEDIRAETWCMTRGMHLNYIGKYLGHTEKYIKCRDEEQLEWARNPNLAKHRRLKDVTGNLLISPSQDYAIMNAQNLFRDVLTPEYRKYAS